MKATVDASRNYREHSHDPIALIIPTLQGGGAECVVSRLSLYWATKRPVVVITWDGRDPAYRFGGSVVDLNLPPASSGLLKFFRQRKRCESLAQTIRGEGATQTIAFMEAATIPLAMVKHKHLPGLRVSVSMRGSPTALGAIARYQVRRWYPRVDRVVMQTAASAEQVIDWGIPRERCVVIPNPLSEEWLSAVRPLPERERDLVVAVGRLDPVKDFSLLLTAFSRLALPTRPRLAILGEGPLRSTLMAQAQALGIGNRVDFVGRVSDVKSWLDRARVFVLTSRHEGFPNALAEAMARGCPVVSTDCPLGPREMISHGHSGWLVPVGDPGALSQALAEALSDDRKAAACALAAHTCAEEWAIDRIATRWLEW